MAPSRKKSSSSPRFTSAGKQHKRDLIMPGIAAASMPSTARLPSTPSSARLFSMPSSARLPPTPKYSPSNPRTPEEFRRDLSPREFRAFKAYRNAIRGVASGLGQPGLPTLPVSISHSDQFVVEKARPPRKTSKISPSLSPDDISSEDEDDGWATEDEYDDHNDLDFVDFQDEELDTPSSDQENVPALFLGDSHDTESSSYDSDLFAQQQSRRETVTSGYLGDGELTPRVHFEDEDLPISQGVRSSFGLKCGNAREVPIDDDTDREGEPGRAWPLPQSKQPAHGRRARFTIRDHDTDSEDDISSRQARRARLNARGEEVPSDDESLGDEVDHDSDHEDHDSDHEDHDSDHEDHDSDHEDHDCDHEDHDNDHEDHSETDIEEDGNAPDTQEHDPSPAPSPLNFGDNFSDSLEHDVSDGNIQYDPADDDDGDILTGDDDGTRLDRRLFSGPGWLPTWYHPSPDEADQTPSPMFVGPGNAAVFDLPPPQIRNIRSSLHGAPLWVVNQYAIYDVWEPYQLPYPVPAPLLAWHPLPVRSNIQRHLPPGWTVHEYPTGTPHNRTFYYINPQGQYFWFAPVQMNRAPEFNTTHQYAPDGWLRPLAGANTFAPPPQRVRARAMVDGVILYTRMGAASVQQQQQQPPPQPQPQPNAGNVGIAGSAGSAGNAGVAGNGDGDDDNDDDQDAVENHTVPQGNKRRRSPGSSPAGSSARPHKVARTSRGNPNGNQRRGTADSDHSTGGDDSDPDVLLATIAELSHRRNVLVGHLEQNLENVTNDRDRVEDQLDAVQGDLAAAEAQLSAVQGERPTLQMRLDDAEGRLKECRERERQLQRQLDGAARPRNDAGAAGNDVPQRGQVDILDGRNALGAADSGSDKCRERCKELERDIKNLEEKVKYAQAAQVTMEAKYTTKSTRLDEAEQNHRTAIRGWMDSFNDVKARLAKANKDLEKARQQPGASGDAGDGEDCEGRCRRAEQAVWDTEKLRKELEAQYRELVAESGRLQRQLRAAQNQLADQPPTAGHRGNARHVDDRVAALTADLANARDLNGKLEEALELDRNMLKAVRAIARTKAEEAADLQKRLDRCEKHGKGLQKRVDGAKTVGETAHAPPVGNATPGKPKGKGPIKPKGKASAARKGKASGKPEAKTAYQRGPNGRLVKVTVESEAASESEAEQGEDVEQANVEQADVEQADVEQANVEQADGEQANVEQADGEQADVEQAGDPVAANAAANDDDKNASDDLSSESDNAPITTSPHRRSSRAKMQDRRRAAPLSSLPSRQQQQQPFLAPPFDPRVPELQHELRTAAVRTNRIVKWHNAQQEAHVRLRVDFDRLMEENGRLKRGRDVLIREVKGLVGVIERG